MFGGSSAFLLFLSTLLQPTQAAWAMPSPQETISAGISLQQTSQLHKAQTSVMLQEQQLPTKSVFSSVTLAEISASGREIGGPEKNAINTIFRSFPLPTPSEISSGIDARIKISEEWGPDREAIKQARIEAYDEAFKRDARERDEYYSKVAKESMAKRDALAKEQADIRRMLEPKYQMTRGDSAVVEARREENVNAQQEVIEKIRESKAQDEEEFRAMRQAKAEEMAAIQEIRKQKIFEERMDAIDTFVDRKQLLDQ